MEQENKNAMDKMLDAIIEDATICSGLMKKVKDESSVFAIVTKDENNGIGSSTAIYMGTNRNIIHSLLNAMKENEDVERTVIKTSKIFALSNMLGKDPIEMFNKYFAEKECDCPDCRAKREEENRSKGN